MARIPATRLVRAINAHHGTSYVLRRRYATGEQGAYALADDTGRRFVLKWSAVPAHEQRTIHARALTTRLRTRGYPAPDYLLWGQALGGSYSIQTALPGLPLRSLTPPVLPTLLRLNALQVGAAPETAPDWPASLVDTVLFGGEGYCRPRTLRDHSTETADLLAVLQRMAARQAHVECATGDIVHFDFNPANVLARRTAVTGVIDWEGASAGDAAFDLATLLFYSYQRAEIRAALWHALRARASVGAAALYLAHLILRQVDWSIRHHETNTVRHYLSTASDILRSRELEW